MDTITFIILLTTLATVSIVGSAIPRSLNAQSHFQLKRAAEHGDKRAKRLYALFGMRYRLQSTLQLCVAFSLVCSMFLVASKVSGPLMLLLNSVLLIGLSVVLPILVQKQAIEWLVTLDGPLNKLMSVSSPLIKHLSAFLERHDPSARIGHSTKRELQMMLESKDLTVGSDITADEARMLRKVLVFSEKKIRDIMTPRRMVRLVAADDELGPVLLDELHKAGHSRFPVVGAADKEPQFVGTLFIRDLAVQKKVRKVSELMSPDVLYIHEEESVDKALRAFLKTRHHLFVVVNNFQEFVGVLSIEDALEEVIGKEIVDESDVVADLREEAKSQAEEELKSRQQS